MARKKKVQMLPTAFERVDVNVEVRLLFDREVKEGTFVHAVDPRELVTIGRNDALWEWARGERPPSDLGHLDGAIVRLLPPVNAAPETVDAVSKALNDAGAAAVRVMPVPRTHMHPKLMREQDSQPARLRDVVTELVLRCRSKDKDLVAVAAEQAMDKAGL